MTSLGLGVLHWFINFDLYIFVNLEFCINQTWYFCGWFSAINWSNL